MSTKKVKAVKPVANDQVTAPFTVPTLRAHATIHKEIESVCKSMTSDMGKYVDLLIQSLVHFHTFGDATAATKLVILAPKGVRVDSVKKWFYASAPMQWSTDKTTGVGQFTKNKKSDIPMYRDNDGNYTSESLPYIERAVSVPFFDMFKEQSVNPFNESIVKRLEGIIKDYDNARTAKGKYKTLKPLEVNDDMNTMIEFIRKARNVAVPVAA